MNREHTDSKGLSFFMCLKRPRNFIMSGIVMTD